MLGWTWDQVRDQLDIPRLDALRAAWAINPPLTVTMRCAAEALGVEFKGGTLVGHAKAPGPGPMPAEFDMAALMAEVGGDADRIYQRPRAGVIVPTATPDQSPEEAQ